MAMTPEQTARYMTQLGVRCPYCQSYDITADRPKTLAHAEHIIEVKVECDQCGKHWADGYILSYVEHREEE